MKIKPKVLIICPFYPPNLGGVETHLKLLADYLSKEGYQTTVLSCKPLTTKVDHYLKFEKKGNLEIHRYWWFGISIFDKATPYPILQFIYIIPGLLIRSFFYLMKHSREYDVIHAHGFAAGFITKFITVFFPIKRKVISTHFIYPPLNPDNVPAKIVRFVFSSFDKILIIGEASGQQLKSLGVDGSKMEVFHHWLDPKVFVPKNKIICRNKLGLPKVRMSVLYVGRILKMKGVFNLLEVAKTLPSDLLTIFVGDGQDFEELNNKAKNYSNIIIAGRRNHEEIIDYLGASDFLILPSIAEEAQPMVVMEALMCGRPVVTTNKGAVGEMFNKEVGLTLDPSKENIKKRILDFYKNPKKLIIMTGKTRKFALNKYGSINAKIITDSYQ